MHFFEHIYVHLVPASPIQNNHYLLAVERMTSIMIFNKGNEHINLESFMKIKEIFLAEINTAKKFARLKDHVIPNDLKSY